MLSYFLCFSILAIGASEEIVYTFIVNVIPSIASQQHVYSAQADCPSTEEEPVGDPLIKKSEQEDGISLNMKYACPEGFRIGIAMFNHIDKQIDKETKNWHYPAALTANPFKEDKFLMKKTIEFGNHFKLKISPKLTKISKLVYRVKVYCADEEGRLMFETFTLTETPVVFNTNYKITNHLTEVDEQEVTEVIGQRCEKYHLRVWPTTQKWLKDDPINEIISEPHLVQKRIIIENGATHNLQFGNHFNLKIEPPLEAKSAELYYAAVKCHGKKNPPTYKMYTKGKLHIVLTGKKCTGYDIEVSKENAEKTGADLSQIPKILAKMRQCAVTVKNGGTTTVKYAEQEPLADCESNDEEEEEFEEDEDDDEEEFGNAEINVDEIDVDEILKSLDNDDGDEDNGLDDDDLLEDYSDDDFDDEPKKATSKALWHITKDELAKSWADLKGKSKTVKLTPKKMKKPLAKGKGKGKRLLDEDDYDDLDDMDDYEPIQSTKKNVRKSSTAKSGDKGKAIMLKDHYSESNDDEPVDPPPKKAKKTPAVKGKSKEKKNNKDDQEYKPKTPRKMKKLANVKVEMREIDRDNEDHEALEQAQATKMKELVNVEDKSRSELFQSFELLEQAPTKMKELVNVKDEQLENPANLQHPLEPLEQASTQMFANAKEEKHDNAEIFKFLEPLNQAPTQMLANEREIFQPLEPLEQATTQILANVKVEVHEDDNKDYKS